MGLRGEPTRYRYCRNCHARAMRQKLLGELEALVAHIRAGWEANRIAKDPHEMELADVSSRGNGGKRHSPVVEVGMDVLDRLHDALVWLRS